MIQVYGRFDGHWSHAQVSRGIVEGLHTNGVPLRVFNVCAAQQPWALPDEHTVYEGLPGDVEVGCVPEAHVGFYVGGYPPMAFPWLESHAVKIALFITESSTLPLDWGIYAKRCDLVVVPSRWVAAAYHGAGVGSTHNKLMLVYHGLHKAYVVPRQGFAPAFVDGKQTRRLVIGHVCGALSFPERKGLPQLVEAFKRVFSPGEAKLVIRTVWTPEVAAAIGRETVQDGWVELDRTVDPTVAMSPQEMRRWLSGLDALVQPSRAEAFGLVPLEARALGVPVVLTAGTGHLEHVAAMDISIPVGADAAIRVNGIPNGTAPTVAAADVALGLEELRMRLAVAPPKLDPEYWVRWSWENVTRQLAEVLKKMPRGKLTLEEKAGF